MSPFALSFGAPERGSLPLSLRVGDAVWALDALGTWNDPLHELAEVAVALAGPGAVDAAARMGGEPGTTVIRFASSERAPLVDVEVSEVADWPPHCSEPPRIVCRRRVERSVVAQALLAALQTLRQRTPRTDEIAGWGSFPTAVLRRLLEHPTTARRFAPPWRDARGRTRFEEELRAEVGLRHPLRGVRATIVAANDETDECLFELTTGPDLLAIVRLTWSGRREKGALSPETQLLTDWSEWDARSAARR